MLRLNRSRGFTLVELLVVIGIIGLLVTFLIGALLPQKKKAMKAKTGALIKAIQTALDQYYGEFHDYPPDGYDKEPGWVANNTAVLAPGSSGQVIGIELPANSGCHYAGSGSLIYFLCYPITNIYTVGADQGTIDPRNVRTTPVGPYLSTLRNEDVTVRLWDPNFDLAIRPVTLGKPNGYLATWSAGEIIDAFGFPIHYDKVKENPAATSAPNDLIYFDKARFTGLAGVHSHTDTTYYTSFTQGIATNPEFDPCGDGTHNVGGTGGPIHGDPRCSAQTDGCYIDGNDAKPRNVNAYDLWAHADSWCNGRSAISNWKTQ